MINDLKVYLKTLRGKFTLAVAGISTGAIVVCGMSGCNKEQVDSVDDPSEIAVVEPSEEISEEISGEVSEVVEENPYKHIPEELLDENGIYHPEEVTADMLRERFADVDEYIAEFNLTQEDKDLVLSSIMRANYSFMSDETFKTIVDEYNIDVVDIAHVMLYDGMDYPAEKYYFDPYLQYEAKEIYELFFDLHGAKRNKDEALEKKYLDELYSSFENHDSYPINLDETNLYEKTNFDGSTAIYELKRVNNFSDDRLMDYHTEFSVIGSDVKEKIKK